MIAVGNKEIVKHFMEEVLTNNRVDEIEACVTGDYTNHFLPPGSPLGPEGEKLVLGQFHNAFSDFTITITDILEEGEKVAVRWRFRGTHDGSLQGIPATGRKVDVQGINIFLLQSGKLKENWPSFDMLGLMQQIGVIPAPGQ